MRALNYFQLFFILRWSAHFLTEHLPVSTELLLQELRESLTSPFLLPELILREYCCPCLGWDHAGWHLALLSCIRWRWHSTSSCPLGVDFVAVLMDACQSRSIECVWSSVRTSRNLIYFTNPDREEVQPELICHSFTTHHFSSFSDPCNHTGKKST